MKHDDSLVTKEYLDKKLQVLKQGLDEKLDLIIGEYKNHEEEHTLINGRLSEHSDQIDTITQKIGITV